MGKLLGYFLYARPRKYNTPCLRNCRTPMSYWGFLIPSFLALRFSVPRSSAGPLFSRVRLGRALGVHSVPGATLVKLHFGSSFPSLCHALAIPFLPQRRNEMYILVLPLYLWLLQTLFHFVVPFPFGSPSLAFPLSFGRPRACSSTLVFLKGEFLTSRFRCTSTN